MLLALTLVVLVLAVFAACRWSGGTLAVHKGDAPEVGAVLVIGACLAAAVVVLARGPLADALWPIALVLGAGAAGLFTGYARSE
jgi:hypothetical protein